MEDRKAGAPALPVFGRASEGKHIFLMRRGAQERVYLGGGIARSLLMSCRGSLTTLKSRALTGACPHDLSQRMQLHESLWVHGHDQGDCSCDCLLNMPIRIKL